MTWNETPHHHISFFNFFHIMESWIVFFFMARCDKITYCDYLFIYLFLILLKKF